MRFEVIEVQCYSGYKHNERPVRFTCRGSAVHITEIIDQWHEGHAASSLPPLDYYKVRGDDGGVHIIRYNHLFDKWALLVSHATSGKKSSTPKKKLA